MQSLGKFSPAFMESLSVFEILGKFTVALAKLKQAFEAHLHYLNRFGQICTCLKHRTLMYSLIITIQTKDITILLLAYTFIAKASKLHT